MTRFKPTSLHEHRRLAGALAFARARRQAAAPLLAALLLAACSTTDKPSDVPRPETVVAVNAQMELLRFNAGQPARVLSRLPLKGLADGDPLVGIDYRVAKGVLYGLSRNGRLYTIDTSTATAMAVGGTPTTVPLQGRAFGVDFNPTVDRIRVVSDAGQNLRYHPDTGAVIDSDPNTAGVQTDGPLAYAAGDPNAGKRPSVMAAAYTYNKQNDKLTTNYAIDGAQSVLVTQGSREGSTPAVSPNTGQLFTVGALGVGRLSDASFDISDVNNTAIAALRTEDDRRQRLYLIDLGSGKATLLGTVGDGGALVGIAIEP